MCIPVVPVAPVVPVVPVAPVEQSDNAVHDDSRDHVG